MTFSEKSDLIVSQNNSLVSVGLDSDPDKIPPHLKNLEYPVFEFNKAIIEATHDQVCAYKPNTAFYEKLGTIGITQLKMTCDHLKEIYPEILVILDAKRADIGNTNDGYASFAFDYLGADAITLQPYLGQEALKPFLDREDKGCIILCRTSNPGAGEIQDLKVTNAKKNEGNNCLTVPLYQVIAEKIANDWNKNNNCMVVVGATYPEELKTVRDIVGDMTILVPGIGAQGGDLEATLKAGLNSRKAGLIINSSRGVIFASSGTDFADKARDEAVKLNTAINRFRGKGETR
jgi:orotidine-5'-phosphate decarboxylase